MIKAVKGNEDGMDIPEMLVRKKGDKPLTGKQLAQQAAGVKITGTKAKPAPAAKAPKAAPKAPAAAPVAPVVATPAPVAPAAPVKAGRAPKPAKALVKAVKAY